MVILSREPPYSTLTTDRRGVIEPVQVRRETGKSAVKSQQMTADTLLHPRWIVPVVPHGLVLENYSIALTGGRISALLPRDEAEAIEARQVLELPGQVLLPGLINCHGHAAMSLLRGYVDDKPLMPWLEQHIWPAEQAHVSEQFVRDGTELAIAEMIRSGTTTFSDMYYFPNVCAATAQRLGMRCQITFPVFDVPSAWGLDADDYISKGLALRDDFKHSTLVTVAFGPHAPYTISEGNLAKVAVLAAELDAAVQIHLHETAGEVLQAVEQNGERPLHTLHRLGLLGPRTQCVHMTDLGDQDIDLLAAAGAHVVHCPKSNMKLASGTCRVSALLKKGVNVALGTDSAASNNDLNMFGEMQAAALLAKLQSSDATALPAADALALATINGARALGLEDSIGSLEVGKQADLIAVDLRGPETQPLYHPLSQLVYACNGSQVSHCWIAGELVMAQRELTRIDIHTLAERVCAWQQRINSMGDSAQ
jgi:5-methylthioadenosine/S-adenosylhomocysteine deaminase